MTEPKMCAPPRRSAGKRGKSAGSKPPGRLASSLVYSEDCHVL
jgi:hypothetical protein